MMIMSPPFSELYNRQQFDHKHYWRVSVRYRVKIHQAVSQQKSAGRMMLCNLVWLAKKHLNRLYTLQTNFQDEKQSEQRLKPSNARALNVLTSQRSKFANKHSALISCSNDAKVHTDWWPAIRQPGERLAAFDFIWSNSLAPNRILAIL